MWPRALDRRRSRRGQRVKQARALSRWQRGEPAVPFLNELPQLVSQFHERHDAGLELLEPPGGNGANLAAGDAASIALAEDARQIVQREAHIERPLDDAHAVQRGRRIHTVTIVAALRGWQQPLLLVVAQRVNADPGGFPQLS
jgi:hypothetical protein